MKKLTNQTKQNINVLVRQIVEEVHPLRVLLFGSAARDTMTQDSDVDLLVEMPEGTHKRKTAQHLYTKVRNIGLPFDLIVATPSELKRYADSPGLIYSEILKYAKEVYAA
jgi:predicted nucleotidyltransferase